MERSVDLWRMSDKSTVLMIDTSMAGCGVGLYCGESGDVFERYHDDARGQAQYLIPCVQGVLEDAGIGFEAISDVVVCCGPGSFTGIRIGLSAAKTLGLVLDVPVYGVTSLAALMMFLS